MTAFHDLRSFLTALDAAGELVRVRCEVDPRLEITQIVQEVVRRPRGGPALLFEQVKGSRFPLAVNLLGSMSRIELAFGRHPEAIGAEFQRLGGKLMPPTLGGVLAEWRALARFRFMRPSRGASPELEDVPEGLDGLPVLTCWPKDAGRFLTFGLVVSANPRTGTQNLGVYRMQVLGPREVAMHWQIQKGGAAHAEETRGPIPVAIAIGADPATMFAAVCPLPEDVDELHFAGLLRGGSTRLARGEAVPLDVPANAEILIEGRVDPARTVPEGPFGDHFGHYSHAAPFPVFTAERIRAKRDAIYVASVVGKPPQEDRAIGDAINMIFTPVVRLIHPELADMWSYHEAGFHNLLVVSVRQRYAKEGIKTALGLLGQGQLSLTKCVILVDPDVSVRSFPEVLRAIGRNFDPAEDLLVLHRTALDTLDFTSMEMNLGSKMILDATSAPGSPRPGPRPSGSLALEPTTHGLRGSRNWEGVLLAVQVGAGAARLPPSAEPAPDAGAGRAALERLLAHPAAANVKLVAAVSEDVELDDDVSLLWGIFTRFDCARDLLFAKAELRGAWPKFTGPVGIDATFKKGYPDVVAMAPEVVERVARRWPDYGIRS